MFSILTLAYLGIFYMRADSDHKHSDVMRRHTNIRFADGHDVVPLTVASVGGTGSTPIRPPGSQACVHPQLELWHPALKGYFKDMPPLQCADEENWVYVDNGTFRISPNAIKNHGEIECVYIPQIRGENDFAVLSGAPINNIKDGTPLVSDFFYAICSAADKKTYKNLHSGIAFKHELQGRAAETTMPPEAMGLDVLMFGFDSTSRMTWMRNLPKSHDYFTNKLGAVVLEGYNIVGDGTPQALLPILTGKSEPELPEARRGKSHARTVDGHPWIWKDFARAGYVTQWGEDGASTGTFTYRMLGFKKQPVDHYMRPYYIQAEKQYGKHKPYCMGSVPRHVNMLHWIRDMFYMYADKPKWSFLFHSEFTHGGYSEVRMVDDDLKQFLELLEEGGYLNNTLLILMADHGARFQAVRQTVQGKYEERMPYFGLRLPPWFEKKYPHAMKNLRQNAHRLTTPYDIHSTFNHILHYNGSKVGDLTKKSISLFDEVPLERTCSDAGIEAHWCACLNWQSVSPEDDKVKAGAAALLDRINSLTEPERDLCVKLRIGNITSANMYIPNDNLLHFKRSSDQDGRVADLSDNMAATEVFFQITMLTLPGEGRFEATVKVNTKTSKYVISDREISRINKYGNQPHCVAAKLPHLRPYCYCMEQIVAK